MSSALSVEPAPAVAIMGISIPRARYDWLLLAPGQLSAGGLDMT